MSLIFDFRLLSEFIYRNHCCRLPSDMVVIHKLSDKSRTQAHSFRTALIRHHVPGLSAATHTPVMGDKINQLQVIVTNHKIRTGEIHSMKKTLQRSAEVSCKPVSHERCDITSIYQQGRSFTLTTFVSQGSGSTCQIKISTTSILLCPQTPSIRFGSRRVRAP